MNEWVKNDTDRWKLKYSEENLSQCHLVNQKSYMEWQRSRPRCAWWWHMNASVIRVWCYRTRAGPRRVSTPGRLISWCPGQTDILQTFFFFFFWNLDRASKLFECTCPICGYFSKKFFHVWKPEFSSTIFLITPVTSYRLASRLATQLACPLVRCHRGPFEVPSRGEYFNTIFH